MSVRMLTSTPVGFKNVNHTVGSISLEETFSAADETTETDDGVSVVVLRNLPHKSTNCVRYQYNHFYCSICKVVTENDQEARQLRSFMFDAEIFGETMKVSLNKLEDGESSAKFDLEDGSVSNKEFEDGDKDIWPVDPMAPSKVFLL